ncbi:efflux RND transporter periplasmic adaptor subunit [Desulfonatronospira sp.]|uniref:efflux RND transporter periplasmic adaptor subunit n=1 Tax=Desulfonatronospira sp. TaxID=1962951 RepID=UPI0025BF26FD|nr:efflux RND transporter periplasmic adaptor subunit [Desulfonatronospira sp.]
MENHQNSPQDQENKRKRSVLGRIFSPWTFLILILAVGVYFYLEHEPEQEDDEPRERPPAAVELAPASEITLLDTVRGVGTLRPVQRVDIRPETSGRIKTVHFQEGTFISKNELLFQIEEQKLLRRLSSQEAALDEARARLENLLRNYQRFSMLRSQEVVSEEEYDQVKTDLESTRAQVRRLKADVDHVREEIDDTVIRAPFDGFISERLADPGSFVSQGETLSVMYQIDPLRISFFLPEKYFAQTAVDQKVRVAVPAYPDESFEGQVDYISPSIDESTRKFRVRADIENPDNLLRPGFFAQATQILGQRVDSLVIPEKSLVAVRDGYMVFTVDPENGRARAQMVSTGMRRPGLVQITDGLSTNDLVVTAGHMQLEDGARVEIVEEMDDDWAGQWDESLPDEGFDTAEQYTGGL